MTRYGVEWPEEMNAIFIDLTVAKKHRKYKELYNIEFDKPEEALLSACRALLTKQQFNISPWTEEHAHDFTHETECITWGCGSSSKSNDYGLFALLDWVTDPLTTLWLVGSTTKLDLRSRTWEAIARYYATLQNNKLGLIIPGKLSEVGFKLTNVYDPNIPETIGTKAGIEGAALNEGGRLQGRHLPYVRMLVDELATLTDYESLRNDKSNTRIGTDDFRFYGLANPEPTTHESSRMCEPEGGWTTVNVNTGKWRSRSGMWVRHHDGLKSPCVTDPALESTYPYLMKQREYDAILKDAGGNPDDMIVWRMARGFPAPSGSSVPTVLDPHIATLNRCGEGLDPSFYPPTAVALGVDPAWTANGDHAIAASPVIRMILGKPVLDFTSRVFRLPVSASSPIILQLRQGVLDILRQPGGPSLSNTAVDSSGNQGLAEDLNIHIGGDCMAVNNACIASELPVRAAGDQKPACEILADRGTESWFILAEFCRAGQVRGLPAEALEDLTNRRFYTNASGVAPRKTRLEPKTEFAKRLRRSPNQGDACALAALAVKERLGILPYGTLPTPQFELAHPEEMIAPPREDNVTLQVDGGADPSSMSESYDFA